VQLLVYEALQLAWSQEHSDTEGQDCSYFDTVQSVQLDKVRLEADEKPEALGDCLAFDICI